MGAGFMASRAISLFCMVMWGFIKCSGSSWSLAVETRGKMRVRQWLPASCVVGGFYRAG